MYSDTKKFDLPSHKRDLLKHKLKCICFNFLNSYDFDKVSINLIESEY